MISSLKLSPVIACEHLRCQLDIKQIPALKQRSIKIKIQKSLLILTSLRQLFHNGQFVRIYLNLELNIREAVGFQLNSPKWYFYTNVVQTFQFMLNGLNSGQVQKSFCPGLAWILIHYRLELGFLTIFSRNIWHEGEVISGQHLCNMGHHIRRLGDHWSPVIRVLDNYEILSAPISEVCTRLSCPPGLTSQNFNHSQEF